MGKIEKKSHLTVLHVFISCRDMKRRIIVAAGPEIAACQLRVKVIARMHMRARKMIKSAR